MPEEHRTLLEYRSVPWSLAGMAVNIAYFPLLGTPLATIFGLFQGGPQWGRWVRPDDNRDRGRGSIRHCRNRLPPSMEMVDEDYSYTLYGTNFSKCPTGYQSKGGVSLLSNNVAGACLCEWRCVFLPGRAHLT